jgi:hypothetical protein
MTERVKKDKVMSVRISNDAIISVEEDEHEKDSRVIVGISYGRFTRRVRRKNRHVEEQCFPEFPVEFRVKFPCSVGKCKPGLPVTRRIAR